MSQRLESSVPFGGQTTFNFGKARKNAARYLSKRGKKGQVKLLPKAYAKEWRNVAGIDAGARMCLLRGHVKDVYGEKQSMRLVKKGRGILEPRHDLENPGFLLHLVSIYLGDIRNIRTIPPG